MMLFKVLSRNLRVGVVGRRERDVSEDLRVQAARQKLYSDFVASC